MDCGDGINAVGRVGNVAVRRRVSGGDARTEIGISEPIVVLVGAPECAQEGLGIVVVTIGARHGSGGRHRVAVAVVVGVLHARLWILELCSSGEGVGIAVVTVQSGLGVGRTGRRIAVAVHVGVGPARTAVLQLGGPDKCAWVKELGADACIDYKAGPVLPQLAAAAPDGIDVYFDNVGGDHLDAAFAVARNFARFAICGMIDRYNDAEGGVEFKYLIRTIPARIRMQGFIFTDYAEHMMEFLGEMGPWVMNGDMKMRETVHQGIGSAFDAFLGLFSGGNTGKMLVKL